MQQVLVALIVIAAAWFATWRLLGAATRLKVLAWSLQRVPAASSLARLLQRLQQQQRAALLGAGCGQCSKAKTE